MPSDHARGAGQPFARVLAARETRTEKGKVGVRPGLMSRLKPGTYYKICSVKIDTFS